MMYKMETKKCPLLNKTDLRLRWVIHHTCISGLSVSLLVRQNKDKSRFPSYDISLQLAVKSSCIVQTFKAVVSFIESSEHVGSPPVFSGVRVTRSLVLCVCFVDRGLSFVYFLLIIVLSVLRYTDSDYLPLVSSTSSYTICKYFTFFQWLCTTSDLIFNLLNVVNIWSK
jgi:hypothetical protein